MATGEERQPSHNRAQRPSIKSFTDSIMSSLCQQRKSMRSDPSAEQSRIPDFTQLI